MKQLLSIVVSLMLVMPAGLMAQDEGASPEQAGPEKKIEDAREVKKDKKQTRKEKRQAKKHANKKKHHVKKHKANKKEEPKKPEVKENAEDVK
ncbi:MAG TPA: hypothetical protein PLM53_03475 [Spirochaetota bacterium]|nr:hypothetical protein [Spirochaetota bacterium]HPC40290.1 hypothetical protein [Spirochaetota bacterium]HPL15333.1 hypothetical protein [Spirochaetota bacterium]HQF07236.1 hypothetical protein [Spirochaetota bacterium]HQH96136.1 hypothetical protein [Spirochaetota bacterium]